MFQHIPAGRRLRSAGLLLLTMTLGIGAAEACRRPLEEQLMRPDRQLAFARDVAVARVVSALPVSDDTVEYRFVVLKRLAGPGLDSFTLHGMASDARFVSQRIEQSDHDGLKFWARGGGRVMNDPACVIRPGLMLGQAYLVILNKPYTWRSFGHIATVGGRFDAEDKWLMYVKGRLGGRL